MDVKRFRDRTFPVYRSIVEGRVEAPPHSSMDTMIFQKGMPKLLITNVIEYFADNFKEAGLQAVDLPNMAPPFNMCWFEGQIPERGHLLNVDGPTNIGATFLAFDLQNPDHSSRDEIGPSEYELPVMGLNDRPNLEEEASWSTHLIGAMKAPDWIAENAWAPTYHLMSLVCGDGSLLRIPSLKDPDKTMNASILHRFGYFSDLVLDLLPSDEVARRNALTLFSIIPILLSICFLHCKNVELVEQESVFRLDNRKVTGRLKKKSRMARVRYHMLTIDPVKKVLATEGKIEEVGGQKALHICRGHFKYYREHGLFGKYKDIYWWNQQLRGSLERGGMVKDYKEMAPK